VAGVAKAGAAVVEVAVAESPWPRGPGRSGRGRRVGIGEQVGVAVGLGEVGTTGVPWARAAGQGGVVTVMARASRTGGCSGASTSTGLGGCAA